MTKHTYTDADLEVVARAMLFGPRQVRIDALNVIRAQAGLAAYAYGISTIPQPTEAAIATAYTNLSAAATAA